MALASLVAYRAGSDQWWIACWALIGGISAYLIAWRVSLALWQMAIAAELKGRQREMIAARQANADSAG